MVPDHVRPIISKLIECGCTVEDTIEGLRVKADEKDLVATDIKTLPYPDFYGHAVPVYGAYYGGRAKYRD